VTGTNCTTPIELALDKNVTSHGLTYVSLDVALVPDVAAQKSTLLTIVPDANVAFETNVVLFCSYCFVHGRM